jgi:Arylsulfotransferase (ASST)
MPRAGTKPRPWRRVCLLCVCCLAGGFLWGYFSHRNHLFPFGLFQMRKVFWERTGERNDLRGLPYVTRTYDPEYEQTGVLLYREDEASEGVNLYCSLGQSEALLIDNRGEILHRWNAPSEEWKHVEVYPDGKILAMEENRRLLCLDRDSNVLWSYEAQVHHDIEIGPDGNIYILTRVPTKLDRVREGGDVLIDQVTVLSPEGAVLRTHPILEMIEGTPWEFLLCDVSQQRLPEADQSGDPLDILHTNHVEVFDGSQEDRWPALARGNLLLSCRTINTILIVDGKTLRCIWAWGPSNLIKQHHPTLLENGNILVFDNGFRESRVLELDPRAFRIVWQYAPGESFFSKTRGSCQRLPNGNTLITESNTGYVFEVTRSGEVVWSFANPDVDAAGNRATIRRMTRFGREELPFLDDLDRAGPK